MERSGGVSAVGESAEVSGIPLKHRGNKERSMAADPRKRQKRLAKRAAKRKAKHHEVARAKSAGLPERMAAAAACPILDSLATTDLWDHGLGWVVLSRELPTAAWRWRSSWSIAFAWASRMPSP